MNSGHETYVSAYDSQCHLPAYSIHIYLSEDFSVADELLINGKKRTFGPNGVRLLTGLELLLIFVHYYICQIVCPIICVRPSSENHLFGTALETTMKYRS